MTEERLRQQIRFEKILKDSYVDAKEDIPEPPIAISKGKLATNAQLVEKAIRIVTDLGASIMTAEETRKKLKLVKHK